MDVKELSQSWGDVDSKIRGNYSSKTKLIQTLVVKKRVQDSLNKTYVVNKKIATSLKNKLDIGTAIVQQQYQFPLIQAAEKAAKAVLNDASTLLSSLKSSIF